MKIIFFIIFLFFTPIAVSLERDRNEKTIKYTICLYRENRKEGKWVKQEIFIDSISYLKIGNRSRAIFSIDTNVGDTLRFKIYYNSLGMKREKELLLPIKEYNDTVYIKSFFKTEMFNPLLHTRGNKPEFLVDGIIMEKKTGKKEFENDIYFKDKERKKINNIEIRY